MVLTLFDEAGELYLHPSWICFREGQLDWSIVVRLSFNPSTSCGKRILC
jgi:hypothetical protein